MGQSVAPSVYIERRIVRIEERAASSWRLRCVRACVGEQVGETAQIAPSVFAQKRKESDIRLNANAKPVRDFILFRLPYMILFYHRPVALCFELSPDPWVDKSTTGELRCCQVERAFDPSQAILLGTPFVRIRDRSG